MEENEITDRELLEIARRKREDIKTYRQQELKSDTPLDTLETVTKSMKAGNRHTKKQKSNRWEAPDREYIKIPNRFIEATYKQNFGANQAKVFWFLIRNTWGWRKKSEFIRVTQCAKELEIPKSRVSEALSSLVKRRIVTVNRNKTYGIQSDTSLWRDLYRKP